MIRIKLKSLLDEKSFNERRKIKMDEISSQTGISRATLSRIANVPGYSANLDAINSLCSFFDCEIEELLEYIPDDEGVDRK